MIPDSRLQNKIANLERQVLEAKKTVSRKQLQGLTTANPVIPEATSPVFLTTTSLATPMDSSTTNPQEPRNLNFGPFYEYEGGKSHSIPFMCKYWLVDI